MKYWVAGRNFVVQVDTDERGIITFAAPLVRKFVGQPFQNLLRWISNSGYKPDYRIL